MEVTFKDKMISLGNRVLNASRNELYLSMRFLDIALGALEYQLYLATPTIGTDGEKILYYPEYLVGLYQDDPVLVNRAYLHMLLHCMFRHMFNGEGKEEEYWNLACDIAVESIIDSLDYKCINLTVSDARNEVYEELEKQLKVLTAEGIYRVLRQKKLTYTELTNMQNEFTCCDHDIWNRLKKSPIDDVNNDSQDKDSNKEDNDQNDENSMSEKKQEQKTPSDGESEDNDENHNDENSDAEDENHLNDTETNENQTSGEDSSEDEFSKDSSSEEDVQKSNSSENGDASSQDDTIGDDSKESSEVSDQRADEKQQETLEEEKASIGDNKDQDKDKPTGQKNHNRELFKNQNDYNITHEQGDKPNIKDDNSTNNDSARNSLDNQEDSHQFNPSFDIESEASKREKEELLNKIWKDISEKTQTNLETFYHDLGDEAEGFFKALKVENRERYDYRTFLRKFAVRKEEIQVDMDSFDYVFYTYGLNMYGNMPLVEPLEYKEVNKIEEFVIVIDTSGSCSVTLVKKFLQESYDILTSNQTFAKKVNIVIIQCDEQVQSVAKIASEDELNKYMNDFEIKGRGGTDFRPAFEYIDKLIEEKEFHKLKGILYFTDGYGIYPKKKPNYDVAFVFLGEDYTDVDVPSWAMKLLIEPGGLQDEY